MTRRILQVVGGMNRAGVETLLMTAYRKLDRSRIQFDFAVTAPEACDYDTEIQDLGGRILRLPHPAAGLLAYWRAFRRMLSQAGPFHAVHSHVHYFSGYVLRLAKQSGVGVRVAHSHTTRDGGGHSTARLAYRWVMRKLILRQATHLLCTARASGLALYGPDCWADQRVRIVPNAIDVAAYAPSPSSRAEIRRRLGFDEHAFLSGHIGRFDEMKNHVFLMQVFAALAARRQDAELVLVGRGPLRHAMEARARSLGLQDRIHFLGVRQDIPDILSALDVFVFPSLHEGLGMVLVEAQAAGVPCVAAESIPAEADMGLGLVSRLPLDRGTEPWTQAILNAPGVPCVPWPERRSAVCSAGYETGALIRALEGAYGTA